jgi:hypothetical protein
MHFNDACVILQLVSAKKNLTKKNKNILHLPRLEPTPSICETGIIGLGQRLCGWPTSIQAYKYCATYTINYVNILERCTFFPDPISVYFCSRCCEGAKRARETCDSCMDSPEHVDSDTVLCLRQFYFVKFLPSAQERVLFEYRNYQIF